MRNEYEIMCATGHHKSYARDQTRDDSPEQRHSMQHVVQHTICATRKQRLVPTKKVERMGQQESCKWSGNVSPWHQKEDGTPTRCLQPTNTEDHANLFHECPIATRHSVQGLGSKVHFPALGPRAISKLLEGPTQKGGHEDPCTCVLPRKQKEHLPPGLTFCGRNALTTFQAPAKGCAQDNSKPKSSVVETIIAAQHGCEQKPSAKTGTDQCLPRNHIERRSVITLRNML